MRCDRCRDERPLEDFELGLARPVLHSHEIQALDRLRTAPAQICGGCYRPSTSTALLDRVLAGDAGGWDLLLDLLADGWDWFRRRRGR